MSFTYQSANYKIMRAKRGENQLMRMFAAQLMHLRLRMVHSSAPVAAAQPHLRCWLAFYWVISRTRLASLTFMRAESACSLIPSTMQDALSEHRALWQGSICFADISFSTSLWSILLEASKIIRQFKARMESLWKSNAFTIDDLNKFEYKDDSIADQPKSTRIYAKRNGLVSMVI